LGLAGGRHFAAFLCRKGVTTGRQRRANPQRLGAREQERIKKIALGVMAGFATLAVTMVCVWSAQPRTGFSVSADISSAHGSQGQIHITAKFLSRARTRRSSRLVIRAQANER
jgi:hypothetical protein